MGKTITKRIDKVELIKAEKVFNNPELKMRYYYNFYFEGFDEPLIVENPNKPLNYNLEGNRIQYKLSDENEIISFEILTKA